MTMSDGSGQGYTQRRAAEASSDAAAAQRQAKQVEDQLARLRLACTAMWELIKEKTSLTEEDLITKIAILDAKDNVADGKMTRTARPCQKCGRTVAAQQNKCMYCGEIQPTASVFDAI